MKHLHAKIHLFLLWVSEISNTIEYVAQTIDIRVDFTTEDIDMVQM